jgi:hypothetical protein
MATSVSAQWLNHPTDGLPRLTDGRPDLAAPAPRTADGKPDLSGVWRAQGDPCDSDNSVTAGLQRPRYFVSVAGCRSPDLPMQPWAAELFRRYEQDTAFRRVFLDGRALPSDPQPSWLGYSVGRWDGDELLVETIGFHDQGWLDSFGHHS